jgi:hypothetical protein
LSSLIFCMSYAVRAEKIATPAYVVTQYSVLFAQKRFTSEAAISPNSAMNAMLPIDERSRFVVYPKIPSAPNIALVIRNVETIDVVV